jgi:hypothetical protein
VAPIAIAQSPDQAADAIEQCAVETDPAKRIACLEAALRGAPVAPSPVTSKEEVVAPEAAEPAPVTPVADTRTETAPPNIIAETPTVPAEPVSSAPELGAEQVAARTVTRQNTPSVEVERQVFHVTSTRTVPYEKLEVSLSNGQVWRQIKGDNQKIRIPRKYRDGLSVEIWNAPVSGYKMRLTELKRTIRVERLK